MTCRPHQDWKRDQSQDKVKYASKLLALVHFGGYRIR